MIELLNIDCMEYMRGCEDNAFDLCVTSPPYNLGKNHHTGSNSHNPYFDDLREDEYQSQQIEMLNQLHRIISGGGSVFYNHKNRIKGGKQISPYEWLFKTNWTIKQEIVWFNGSQNFDKIRFYPMTERVYWLVKDTKTVCENVNGLNDFIPFGHWPPEGTYNDAGHARAFPIKMVQEIAGMFPDAKRMLDPYSGSGSSAIAAHNLGLDFVGCELSEEYHNAALKRLDLETRQISLF